MMQNQPYQASGMSTPHRRAMSIGDPYGRPSAMELYADDSEEEYDGPVSLNINNPIGVGGAPV